MTTRFDWVRLGFRSVTMAGTPRPTPSERRGGSAKNPHRPKRFPKHWRHRGPTIPFGHPSKSGRPSEVVSNRTMPQDGEDQIWDGQPKVVVGRIREGLSFAIAVDHVSRFAKLQSQIVQGKHGLPAQFFSGCDPAVLENERTHIDSRRLEAPHKKKKTRMACSSPVRKKTPCYLPASLKGCFMDTPSIHHSGCRLQELAGPYRGSRRLMSIVGEGLNVEKSGVIIQPEVLSTFLDLLLDDLVALMVEDVPDKNNFTRQHGRSTAHGTHHTVATLGDHALPWPTETSGRMFSWRGGGHRFVGSFCDYRHRRPRR